MTKDTKILFFSAVAGITFLIFRGAIYLVNRGANSQSFSSGVNIQSFSAEVEYSNSDNVKHTEQSEDAEQFGTWRNNGRWRG